MFKKKKKKKAAFIAERFKRSIAFDVIFILTESDLPVSPGRR